MATEDLSKKKRTVSRLLFGVSILLFGAYILYSGVSGLTDDKTRLVTPKGNIHIEIVESDQDRAKGLSDRSSIATDEGMLFVFEKTSTKNCFWMKDMQFSIDMIWLNDNKEVVTVTPNVDPGTFPESFCPDKPAKYGLEIAANGAEPLEIKIGQKLRF